MPPMMLQTTIAAILPEEREDDWLDESASWEAVSSNKIILTVIDTCQYYFKMQKKFIRSIHITCG